MIIWDEEKNKKLKKERNLSFEEIAQMILEGNYIDILENPARTGQYLFVLKLGDYIHAVPFVIDENSNIILKTAYPSRKFHQIYGKGNL